MMAPPQSIALHPSPPNSVWYRSLNSCRYSFSDGFKPLIIYLAEEGPPSKIEEEKNVVLCHFYTSILCTLWNIQSDDLDSDHKSKMFFLLHILYQISAKSPQTQVKVNTN